MTKKETNCGICNKELFYDDEEIESLLCPPGICSLLCDDCSLLQEEENIKPALK